MKPNGNIMTEEDKMNDKPKFEKHSIVFYQKGNVNESTKQIESLTVKSETYLDDNGEEKSYYVFRSETGWTVHNMTNIQEVLDIVDREIDKQQ
jgi:hypothetical protein